MLVIFDFPFCDFTPLSVTTKVLLLLCTLDHFMVIMYATFSKRNCKWLHKSLALNLHLKLFLDSSWDTVLFTALYTHSKVLMVVPWQGCSHLTRTITVLINKGVSISFSLYGDAANYSRAATKQGQHVIAEIHVQYAQGTCTVPLASFPGLPHFLFFGLRSV